MTMIEKPNGGAAFPELDHMGDGNPGMTLRDWFAGQALAGRLARVGLPSFIGSERIDAIKEFARDAYQLADAMIAEMTKNA